MRILFTSTQDAPFIRDDLSFLRQQHQVEALTTTGFGSIPAILAGVLRSEITFTWFASVYAAVVVWCATLFRRRSIVVVGGVDAAHVPEFGYGIWTSRWKRFLVRYAMRNADLLLAVTPFLRDQAVALAGYDGANIRVVPTGYDPSFWISDGTERDLDVLTVASCETLPRMSIKGIPLLIEVARKMQDVRFTLIGPREEALSEIRRLDPPPNLTVVPPTPREALLTFYRRASVYCQPSYYEGGLGSCVCEAMLCGCIPVVTAVGGMPEAVADHRLTAPSGDPHILEERIRFALSQPEGMREQIRRNIENRFTLSRREGALAKALSGLAR